MEATVVKRRRPWLAALLGLLGGPVGQVYAGGLRRGMALWLIGACILPAFMFGFIALPLGRSAMILYIVCELLYAMCVAVDAFFLAKRNRDAPLKRYQRWWMYLLLYLAVYGANFTLNQTLRRFVVESFVVAERAMSPTIQPGDRVLVDKLWSTPSDLRQNDIVVFRSRGPGSTLFIKRLVGLPGDEIAIVDDQLFVNGTKWDDPHAYLDPSPNLFPELSNYDPTTVPLDSFFVLGDNRRRSLDSRWLGPIPFADLYGKARLIYWSHERIFPDPDDMSQYVPGKLNWERIGTRLD